MLGVMTMFSGLARTQKSIGQSVDFDNLAMLVRMALQNPATCPSALKAPSGAPLQFPPSLTTASPDLPAAGVPIGRISLGALLVDTTVPYNGLYIESIRLKQVVVGNPSPASALPYTAVLRLEGSKTPPGAAKAVGGGILSREVPIALTIHKPNVGNATLISCGTIGVQGTGSTGPNLSNCVTIYVPFIDDELPRVQKCPSDHPYFSGIWVSQEGVVKDSDKITQIQCCT
jgi:hypothetical protein